MYIVNKFVSIACKRKVYEVH